MLAFLVSLPDPMDASTVRESAHVSWRRLRRDVPLIACRTKGVQDETRSWYLEYEVPKDDDDVTKWIEETVIWHEDRKSLSEREKELQMFWWTADAGRYAYTLHIAPDTEALKYQFLCAFCLKPR